MSIFDRFRRKPKPPAPDLDEASDAIVKALQEAGLLPPGAKPQIIIEDRRASPGIQPTGEHPSAMAWKEWLSTMKHMEPPAGWSPCRFGTRLWNPDGTDRAEFVYGVVRACFGIFTRPLPVCDEDDDEAHEAIIANLTHLPTGVGLAMFCDRATACAAVDTILSLQLGIAWETIGDLETDHHAWDLAYHKAIKAISFNGFAIEARRHAHAGAGGPAINIWARPASAVLEGMPEKLS